MTLHVDEPTGGWIGPGLLVNVYTDLIGPLPANNNYRLRVVPHDTPTRTLWSTFMYSGLHRVTTWVGRQIQPGESVGIPTTARASGTSVDLVVDRYDDILTLAETLTVAMLWSEASATFNLLRMLEVASLSDPRIDQILAAVIRTFPP